MSLAKKMEATSERLHHFEELERPLAETERHLGTERATVDVLQAEVASKDKHLKAALAREADLVAQVSLIKKQLDLLSV